MSEYFHSVRLMADRCKGCVNCIKRCPTEAIRIRGGKAKITEARCIDCGECIRRCANRAKAAVTDGLDELANFKYNVALPAPSLYSQFGPDVPVNVILCALRQLGFDEVFEVARGAEIVTAATREYLQRKNIKKPAISTACPAVVRLVQVKFPELIDNLIAIEAPVEVAARLVRTACSARGLKPEEVGVWFITPCPAKMTAVRQPLGFDRSNITGAIAINQIYGELLKVIPTIPRDSICQRATANGAGWAMSGGEAAGAGAVTTLVVDEIHNVSDLLEQVALGKIKVDFIEALACSGGCIGGPLTVDSRFVASHRMQQRLAKMRDEDAVAGTAQPEYADDPALLGYSRVAIEPRPIMRLDDDIFKAMYKVELMEQTLKKLPGLDCGSCGSPNCKALAEDIVQGTASETDCVFKLRERVRDLAREMVDLAEKMPPSLEKIEEQE